MTWRHPLLAAVLASAALAAGACGSGGPDDIQPPGGDAGYRAGPKELRELKAEANQLLGGEVGAFKARVARLRGYPVVVNQWASWCDPCREEFPFFQRLAKKYDGRVAFLGVDSLDNDDNARKFLREFPTPYPHYIDPDGDVGRVFGGGRGFPTTGFYDRSGKLTSTHIGAYATEAKLDEDIKDKALGG